METNNKKILTVSFMFAGIVAGAVIHILMGAASAISGVAARYLTTDSVKHGLPVLAGLALFLYLQFNSQTLSWADEVVQEMKRVVWPSQRDTAYMTVAVVFMVLISAVILGIIDVGSSHFIKMLVELPPLFG